MRDRHRALAAQLGWRNQKIMEERKLIDRNKPNYAGLLNLSAELQSVRQAERRVFGQRQRHYQEFFHKALPALARQWQQRLTGWDDLERRMHHFFGISPGLWDLEAGTWQRIDWQGLEEAARGLASWPELQILATLLGRTHGEINQPIPSVTVLVHEPSLPEYHVEALGRSEITAYTRGTNLSLLPASEIAYLSDPVTENLFLKRHAEAALTNLEYRTELEYWVQSAEIGQQSAEPEPERQGPVIICTDTSGSMTGIPEQVAKALTLALARTCLQTGRGCFLIGFSSGIQCFDLSDPLLNIEQLSDFMIHGFRGGTDLRPALAKSLELLDNSAWKQADLLIISDFRVPKLMIKKSHLIEPIRAQHAVRLHALSISSGDPSDDLHIFDSRWHFRISGTGQALGIASPQFHQNSSIFNPIGD